MINTNSLVDNIHILDQSLYSGEQGSGRARQEDAELGGRTQVCGTGKPGSALCVCSCSSLPQDLTAEVIERERLCQKKPCQKSCLETAADTTPLLISSSLCNGAKE